MTGLNVAPTMAFWARVEAWLLELQRDRARAARYFQVAYWISLAFVVVGFAVMLLVLLGKWRL